MLVVVKFRKLVGIFIVLVLALTIMPSVFAGSYTNSTPVSIDATSVNQTVTASGEDPVANVTISINFHKDDDDPCPGGGPGFTFR